MDGRVGDGEVSNRGSGEQSAHRVPDQIHIGDSVRLLQVPKEAAEMHTGEIDVRRGVHRHPLLKDNRATSERPETVLFDHWAAGVHRRRCIDLVALFQQVLPQRGVGVSRGKTRGAALFRRGEGAHGIAARDDDDSPFRRCPGGRGRPRHQYSTRTHPPARRQAEGRPLSAGTSPSVIPCVDRFPDRAGPLGSGWHRGQPHVDYSKYSFHYGEQAPRRDAVVERWCPVTRKITDPGPPGLLDAVERPGTVITPGRSRDLTPGAPSDPSHLPPAYRGTRKPDPTRPRDATRAAPPKWDRPRGESGWSRNS